MIRSIFKEVSIMILICLAIALVLGVIFYDYIPNNKVLPSKIAYETPKNVKQEIEIEITEYEKENVVYEITDSDLNLYRSTKSYIPGKADPFADLSNEVAQPENEVVSGVQGTSNTTKNPDATGTFFKDTGTK